MGWRQKLCQGGGQLHICPNPGLVARLPSARAHVSALSFPRAVPEEACAWRPVRSKASAAWCLASLLISQPHLPSIAQLREQWAISSLCWKILISLSRRKVFAVMQSAVGGAALASSAACCSPANNPSSSLLGPGIPQGSVSS